MAGKFGPARPNLKSAVPVPPDELLPLREKQENARRLFDLSVVARRWEDVWVNMPLFEAGNTQARTIHVHFRSDDEAEEFGRVLGTDITPSTKTIWFTPDENYVAPRNMTYSGRKKLVPRYPIYIPSVGRWERPLTANALDRLGVPHRVVVEPAQRDDYARALGEDRLLVLPHDYSRHNTGSIPARNWIWEHSIKEGHERHWVIDDNVRGFLRFNRNRRIAVDDGAIFRAAEDFTDRYENIAFSGFNYMYFINERSDTTPPYYLNTRVYSMILVNNSLEHRWRGRYNEDTDICLRALKDGWCTVLFNAFIGDKVTTMSMKGGNTDTVYAADDRRLEFARSLERQHPDVARVVWRYNRWHHEVDYSRFARNRLVEREGWRPADDPEYGMSLVRSTRKTRYPRRGDGDQEGEAGSGDSQSGASRGEEGVVPAGDPSGDPRGPRRRVQR